MKSIWLFFLLFGTLHVSFAQQHYLDSLRKQLNDTNKEDTFRVKALCLMADYFGFVQFDSCLFYATPAADLSEKLNYEYGRFLCSRSKFFAFNCKGNFPMALEQALNYDRAFEKLNKEGRRSVGTTHYFVGVLYSEMTDYPAAINMFRQTIETNDVNGWPMTENFFTYSQLALIYLNLNRLDSALWYAQKGYNLGLKSNEFKKYFSLAIGALGTIHVALHHYKLAEDLFRYAIHKSGEFNNIYLQAGNYYNIASLFEKENLKDSAIYYADISLRLCLEHNFAGFTLNASKLLTSLYDSKGKADSTLKYMRILLEAKDSVFSQSKGQQFKQFAFNEVQRKQKVSADLERYQNKVRLYILIAALIVFFIIAFMLYRNNRQKQRAKSKIEKAYLELKSTQAQLVQSEKMASLGELTAGIAHEIQNPLNFVNNFSEVNIELLVEMKDEMEKGNIEDAKEIANDVIDNSEKINYHGKRAGDIVKGMLQHSRSSTGVKEPTDINALADEYLRLSYHGLRAKDKNFNATMKTNFDETIGKIKIIPQDVGRVLLNLFNNAFFACAERSRSTVNQQKSENLISYEPTVSVTTKKSENHVIITVGDNGNGIPQKIVDKIFQPFFTTKPTGQGTGLGLSLSYDIVKAHGGGINVETKEEEGTTFIIQLPNA
ncbi:MAG: ATP-binding protein [Ginsengibacter sp.]